MQTGYVGLNTLYYGLRYDGGFVEWYYIPKEKIAFWPSLKNNQELNGEPVLVLGASWHGPIKVPQSTVGFSETLDRNAAGPFYKILVEGIQFGEGRENRVILENMPYHEFIIVGKLRAGGFWVMIGNEESGLQFDHKTDNGKGYFNTSKNEIAFVGESIHKALILPSFESQDKTPMPGASEGSGESSNVDCMNITEIIPFTDQTSISIPFTDVRKTKFGAMPTFEVWFREGLAYQLANIPIIVDAHPPDTTVFTIDFFGITSGFIVLK